MGRGYRDFEGGDMGILREGGQPFSPVIVMLRALSKIAKES